MSHPVIYARFSGICDTCGQPFGAGTTITFIGGVTHHVSCPESEEDDPFHLFGGLDRPTTGTFDHDTAVLEKVDRAKLCDACFAVHGPGQRECW